MLHETVFYGDGSKFASGVGFRIYGTNESTCDEEPADVVVIFGRFRVTRSEVKKGALSFIEDCCNRLLIPLYLSLKSLKPVQQSVSFWRGVIMISDVYFS